MKRECQKSYATAATCKLVGPAGFEPATTPL